MLTTKKTETCDALVLVKERLKFLNSKRSAFVLPQFSGMTVMTMNLTTRDRDAKGYFPWHLTEYFFTINVL
jgi:hypothetical protein